MIPRVTITFQTLRQELCEMGLRANTLRTEPPPERFWVGGGAATLVLSAVADRSGSTELGVRHRFQSRSFSSRWPRPSRFTSLNKTTSLTELLWR